MRIQIAALVLTAAATSVLAWPDRDVHETRPANKDVLVEIEDIGGQIRVIGWDQEQVKIDGRLSPNIEELEVDGNRRRLRIEGNSNIPHGGNSDLQIHVPVGASVEIDVFSAEIEVRGVEGSVTAETVNGGITVSGSNAEVDVETVNGAVSVTGPARRVHAESVNGRVEVDGVRQEVDASTVNGTLRVVGAMFERASLETVNGAIRFEGGLTSDASLSAESVGGSVTLTLPADTSADFSLASFSGTIEHDFDAPAARRVSRWTSEKELHFTLGKGGASVSVNTLSGSINIRRKQ